jgi:hypothetical protein
METTINELKKIVMEKIGSPIPDIKFGKPYGKC